MCKIKEEMSKLRQESYPRIQRSSKSFCNTIYCRILRYHTKEINVLSKGKRTIYKSNKVKTRNGNIYYERPSRT